jgi:two-component system, LytTR family, response regulator LytT
MKVLVVENSPSKKEKIIATIGDLEWTLLEAVSSLEQATAYLVGNTPDLIIANMFLGDETHIEGLLTATEKQNIPILFLMPSGTDAPYINFLLKPFHKQSLKAAASLLLPSIPLKTDKSVGIQVRGKQQQKKIIPLEEILWITVERNYCFLKTENNRYGLKTSLSQLMPLLDKRFMQIHRSCVVNSDYIDSVKISRQELRVKTTVLPVGRFYKNDVLTYLADRD